MRGHSGIIELKDVVKDPASKTTCIVNHALIQIFDHLDNLDFRSLIPEMNDTDVRFYLYELLKVHFFPKRAWIFVIQKESCTET